MTLRLLTLAAGAMLMTFPAMARDVAPASASATTAALSPVVNRAVAERAAELLAKRYVDPAQGARYAAALRRHAAAGDYAGYRDAQALADRLTADLRAVAADGHLRFYRTQPPSPPAPAAAPGTPPQEGERSIAPGIRALSWIEPGVAYLSFEHFDDRPEAMGAIRQFLTDHASARAVIIDSRGNFGGAFPMMGLLADRLFGEPRLLANMDMASSVVTEHGAPFPIDGAAMRRTAGPDGLVRFQHWAAPSRDASAWFGVPVYYLTSHRTFSAAEHLAMVLKSSRRGTLIGETTGGGNHFGGTEPVGAGLEMYVPVGRATDPATGKDWEGTGIAPDVAVPEAEALDEALRRIHARG